MARKLITAVLAAVLCWSSLAALPAPAAAAGRFQFTYFPHQGLDNDFFNDWLQPRDDGERLHRGNDIFAPRMTPVVAVADGFITFVGTTERPGNQVRIRHAEGWDTFYFHLNNDTPGTDDGRGEPEHAYAPGIEAGVFVTAGTVIGYVGDSGNAEHTEPHTHFELRRYGVPVNPYFHLRAAQARQLRVHERLEKYGIS